MRARAHLLAVLLAAWPAGAGAQTLMDATDPEAVAAIVRGFGAARIGRSGDETPMIDGRIDGTPFAVFFYECNDEKAECRSVSFSARWAVSGISLETVNEWNRVSRFGRAYLDGEGRPVLEYDVNLFGSVTEANFEDYVDWWRIVLESFEAVVDEGASTDESPDGSEGDLRGIDL